MSKTLKVLKVLWGSIIGIPASILGMIIWESSIFEEWHEENPLTIILNWLTTYTEISRLILLSSCMP